MQHIFELVAKREAVTGVDRLQTLYCKYNQRNEAIANQSWQLAHARKNYERSAAPLIQGDAAISSDLAPESVTLKIVQAPAEFSVPVKQDR
jgi:hypothetical protein